MGLSDAIIGLTIFAMVCILSFYIYMYVYITNYIIHVLKGNSLGDFVANITIAKMGFPTMAVSACFGGPMLSKFNIFYLLILYIISSGVNIIFNLFRYSSWDWYCRDIYNNTSWTCY